MTTGDELTLIEACRRLDLALTGPPVRSFNGKSIGAPVQGPDGARSWVKITGRRDSGPDVRRDRELAAGKLAGLPKPDVVGAVDWSSHGVSWRALQMTLASSPTVETTPWAGVRARQVTDAWITELRDALASVARADSDLVELTPEAVAGVIRSRFGASAPCVAQEWRVSYGGAHWANLTAPHLVLLDWEGWGLAPRGYDAAQLIALSVGEPSLVSRLDVAFADDLRTPSGRVAQLTACAQVLCWIDLGLMHPGLRGPVARLASRALRRR